MSRCGCQGGTTSSETFVEGAGLTEVTGLGTSGSPFIVNTEVAMEGDALTVVTGTGTSGDPFVITTKKQGAFVLIIDDPDTVVATGDGQLFFTVPTFLGGNNITSVHASLPGSVASTGTTVQLARIRAGSPVDVLSTAVTIDATEATSYTAATPPVVNAANDDLVVGDFLRVDVDAAGTGGKGLQVLVGWAAP